MHIIFYKSTPVLRSLLVPFFRGIHNYVKVISSYHVSSQRIQELLGVFFKHENVVFNGEQEKESFCCVRVG